MQEGETRRILSVMVLAQQRYAKSLGTLAPTLVQNPPPDRMGYGLLEPAFEGHQALTTLETIGCWATLPADSNIALLLTSGSSAKLVMTLSTGHRTTLSRLISALDSPSK